MRQRAVDRVADEPAVDTETGAGRPDVGPVRRALSIDRIEWHPGPADVRPAGTCLGIDGRFIGDPVDCSLPHAEESVGPST